MLDVIWSLVWTFLVVCLSSSWSSLLLYASCRCFLLGRIYSDTPGHMNCVLTVAITEYLWGLEVSFGTFLTSKKWFTFLIPLCSSIKFFLGSVGFNTQLLAAWIGWINLYQLCLGFLITLANVCLVDGEQFSKVCCQCIASPFVIIAT